MIRGNGAIQAISPKDLLVYLCLCRYKNSNTGKSSVPIAKIVKQTGAAPVTVLSSLQRLEKSGHINCVKEGRTNSYGLLSNINASSYAFLDEDIPYAKKAEKAVEVALIEDLDEPNDRKKGTNKLHGYVVQLEEEIVQMKKQMRIMAVEVDNLMKCMSVISGKPYTPLDLSSK